MKFTNFTTGPMSSSPWPPTISSTCFSCRVKPLSAPVSSISATISSAFSCTAPSFTASDSMASSAASGLATKRTRRPQVRCASSRTWSFCGSAVATSSRSFSRRSGTTRCSRRIDSGSSFITPASACFAGSATNSISRLRATACSSVVRSTSSICSSTSPSSSRWPPMLC